MATRYEDAVVDELFAVAEAQHAAYAVMQQTSHVDPKSVVADLAIDVLDQFMADDGGDPIGDATEDYYRYTARLHASTGQELCSRHVDSRLSGGGASAAVVARLLQHAFPRGLPVSFTRSATVVDAWDPRWPLGIRGDALQPGWAYDVLRRHGFEVDASPGSVRVSIGWEAAPERDPVLAALGKVPKLVFGALSGDRQEDVRSARTVFEATVQGFRIVEERNGTASRDVSVPRSEMLTFGVLAGVGGADPQHAELYLFERGGPRELGYARRAEAAATPEVVGALRIAFATAVLGG